MDYSDLSTTTDVANTASMYQMSPVTSFFYFVFVLLYIIGSWKVFVKAGHHGWAAFIPVYNLYVMLKIAGRPGWWLILLLIPLVNIVALLLVSMDIAKNFGKSAIFGIVGLFFFSFIGYLILGFGDAKYVGTTGANPVPATTTPEATPAPPAPESKPQV